MTGQAEVDRRGARREIPYRLQLLVGRCDGGLDCGDLAQPALLPGLLEQVAQVGVDVSSLGTWAGSTRRRGHLTGAFVRTGDSEVATADQYDVRGLNTVRQAEAILQGLIEPAQGRGRFAVALPQPAGEMEAVRKDADDLKEVLETAQSLLSRILRHLG